VTYPARDLAAQTQRKVVHQDYDVSSRLNKLQVDSVDYASDISYNAASQTK
jgi:hypothetical protein